MILDSSYLFGLLAGDPPAQRAGLEVEAAGGMQWLPTPAIAETCYGAAVAGPGDSRDVVADHLRGYPRLEVDVEVARTAGELLAAAEEPNEVSVNVAYVGAMAEIIDERVLTADGEAFEALGVDVREF